MDSRGAQAPKILRRVSVPEGTASGDSVAVDGTTVVVTSVLGTNALALVPRT